MRLVAENNLQTKTYTRTHTHGRTTVTYGANACRGLISLTLKIVEHNSNIIEHVPTPNVEQLYELVSETCKKEKKTATILLENKVHVREKRFKRKTMHQSLY